MASGISHATIAGNVTRDAELKSDRLLTFSVAVNKYEKSGDDAGERAHFFDVKVLGNRAQPLAGILTKGTKVTVIGDLVQERWETDGQNRSTVRILAREVVLGGSGNQGSQQSESKSDDDPGW